MRSAQPMPNDFLSVEVSEVDEIAAAIQIIEDGQGGFTVKNEPDPVESLSGENKGIKGLCNICIYLY